jgi:hypothetical protein
MEICARLSSRWHKDKKEQRDNQSPPYSEPICSGEEKKSGLEILDAEPFCLEFFWSFQVDF